VHGVVPVARLSPRQASRRLIRLPKASAVVVVVAAVVAAAGSVAGAAARRLRRMIRSAAHQQALASSRFTPQRALAMAKATRATHTVTHPTAGCRQ
jgi:hypothetical protein